MTRVLLVDDHAAFREPLAFMFGREPEFEVVGETGTLEETREALQELDVDVAVIDLDLPDGNGTALIPDLREDNPDAIALVLTASADRAEYARAVEAGAAGVLHKSSRIRDVIAAARSLLEGQALLSPNEVGELLQMARRRRQEDHEARQAIEELTPREREVLQCLSEGLSDKEIATNLYVTAGTVRNHVVRILEKLQVHSRLQALVFAIRHGLVKLD